MKPILDALSKLTFWRAVLLAVAATGSYVAAICAGELLMRRTDVSVINEANRRIDHLNIRLKAALDGGGPLMCPTPPENRT